MGSGQWAVGRLALEARHRSDTNVLKLPKFRAHIQNNANRQMVFFSIKENSISITVNKYTGLNVKLQFRE